MIIRIIVMMIITIITMIIPAIDNNTNRTTRFVACNTWACVGTGTAVLLTNGVYLHSNTSAVDEAKGLCYQQPNHDPFLELLPALTQADCCHYM